MLRHARWAPDGSASESRFPHGGGGASRGPGDGEAAPGGGSQGAWATTRPRRDGGRFNLLHAVRHAAVLSEVIADSGVEIERRGQAMYARCPFHGDGNERSPSLSINDEIGKFRCFACDERGDVFQYLMLKENLSFRQALSALASRYDVQRPLDSTAPVSAPISVARPAPPPLTPEARTRQLSVLEASTSHYEGALRSRSAQACADMLRRRGVRSPTASLFRLGFAPPFPPDSLARVLLSGGYTAEEIIDAGLALRRNDGSLFDRFGGRLVIPIMDAAGKVVGFGARRVETGGGGGAEGREGAAEGAEGGEGAAGGGEGGRRADTEGGARGRREAPKYINSKESPLFRKGELLYALPMASAAARKENSMIIVEG
jgi:DNA primase